MENAYMIRNDGVAIPVVQHLYGNIDEITETLYAGEWLYKNTRYDSTENQFIDLIGNYAVFYEGLENPKTVISDLIAVIKSYPYKYLSEKFVEEHSDAIVTAVNKALYSGGKAEMQKLSNSIISELNQEFLRARYGGLYNTNHASREMVFRVSSTGFNWYNIIWNFVYEHDSMIDCVTIVRDEESTGVINGFYRAKDGREYNRYPIDDFIMEKGNPVVETNDKVRFYLAGATGSLLSMKMLPLNNTRIDYRLKALRCQENKERVFYDLTWKD